VSWYDEHELPIGKPVSKRYSKDNCWLRDYANAKIIVNPTRILRKVRIDDTNLWLGWASKKTVPELELPPQTGKDIASHALQDAGGDRKESFQKTLKSVNV
jgi:hypothetical protein